MLEQRPWLKHYRSSIPADIDVQQYNSLLEMLEESFKKYASLPAFSNMGKTMTYSEIDKLSNQFGAFLQSKGLKKGDRIAIMMPNLLQYPIALFGAFKAGLVVVNTNPLYTPREMEHQLTDAGATAIVILENFAHNLEKILPKTNIKLIITTSIGEMLPFLKRSIVNYVVRNVKKMVPAYSLPAEIKFGKAIADGGKLQLQRQTGTHDDVILLQYTGGTTGVSKGAMLTNRNMIANMLQGAAFMSPFTVEGKETMLCPLPIYHIFAFTMNVLIPMNGGFHSILVTNPREIKTVIDTFKKYPISMMTGVNTLFNALVNNEDFKKLDFSKLKIAGAGGMALQRVVAEKW
ncbi:MAG: AMP-binding protein, partial [Saprospiraceae bacterium]|nr:AMP-binding protein [Saprospiraceae bacterium]